MEDILAEVYQKDKELFSKSEMARLYEDFDFNYRENEPIRNIIVDYFWYFLLQLNSKVEYNSRVKYDCDAYYYKNKQNLSDEDALYGDTLASFFMPYSACVKREVGKCFKKSVPEDMFELLKCLDSPDEKLKNVNEKFHEFAKLCYTKGNFILLPSENIPDKKMNSVRGLSFQDRIDETVYHCFNGGKLSKYFNNDDDKVRDWLKAQHLNLSHIFDGEFNDEKDGTVIDGALNKENVKLLIAPKGYEDLKTFDEFYNKIQSHFKFESQYISLEKIYGYINIVTDIIKKRNDL